MLSMEQLTELLSLLEGADSVELKLSVPDTRLRTTVSALGMDPLDAQLRQVTFFDTPELTLSQHGVVVRARRVQNKPGDSVVKLRPVQPDHLSSSLRKAPNFGVEVDAMPGGFVCSGTMKSQVEDGVIKDVLAERRPIGKLFSKDQRALFAQYAPEGVELNALRVLGPVNVLKLKFRNPEYAGRLVAELWFYPGGSRILELSTKCVPADAFRVVAETKAFLANHGVDLGAPQQTKTKAALEYFAADLSSDGVGA